MDLLGPVGVGVVLFASTDIDDLFVLIGFFALARFRARNVIIGQYLGIGALVVVSVVGSLISLVLPSAYVGLLGVLPTLIGVHKLFDLARGASDEEAQARERGSGAIGQIASVAVTTVANGGDNIGAYTPLFATWSVSRIAVVVAVFFVMTALWLAVAHWLVNHPRVGAPVRRYGHVAVPFVLIALGLFILYEAGSFALLR
jgi:cadmium resistance transport/sequestration family protein